MGGGRGRRGEPHVMKGANQAVAGGWRVPELRVQRSLPLTPTPPSVSPAGSFLEDIFLGKEGGGLAGFPLAFYWRCLSWPGSWGLFLA